MYKMFEISVEKHTDAKVLTITVGNRRLFWVRMHDVQEGLCVKNMADLVRKERNSWKDQLENLENMKDLEKNGLVLMFILMFIVILSQE